MKVLVAVDKSEESQKALKYACHLLEHFDAKVDAVYVKPDESDIGAETLYAPFAGQEQIAAWIEKEAEAVAEGVLSSCEVCESGKVPCWPKILTGDPADEILHLAETQCYDLIVLGAQEHSALKGLILGAVHAKILHHARQPVLIVRNFRPIHRILIAYRGSECDQDALGFIGRMMQKRKPEITILHVQEAGKGENEPSAQICLLNAGQKRPKYLSLISDEALNIARLTTRPVLVFRDTAK